MNQNQNLTEREKAILEALGVPAPISPTETEGLNDAQRELTAFFWVQKNLLKRAKVNEIS